MTSSLLKTNVKLGRIIETGHYYSVKGPTIWSKIGWEIMQKISTDSDESAIFIDDFHQSPEDIHPEEKNYPTIDFQPAAENVFYENAENVKQAAEDILGMLFELHNKKWRPKKRANGEICLNGRHKIPLKSPEGRLSCVLLDAGLSLLKYQLGFRQAVNILPSFYKNEQRKLLIILNRVLPELNLRVILYNLEGEYWDMEI